MPVFATVTRSLHLVIKEKCHKAMHFAMYMLKSPYTWPPCSSYTDVFTSVIITEA